MKKILLILSLFSAIYWFVANSINVYQYAIVGALFELTSILMLIILFVVPILSLYYWYKEKFNLKSIYFYTMVISVFTLLLLMTKK
jgi:hypothetical protein